MDNLVSKSTQEALMELIKACFRENRVLDRLVSILGVKFVMNQTADFLHLRVSHYFPILADRIGELTLERYNIPVIYGETPKADEDYASVTECLEVVERHVIDFQAMMMGVCKIAFEHNDIQVYTDMLDLLKEFNLYTEQAILLKDKIDAYGEDRIMAFDHDLKDFIVLKGE